MQYLFNHCTYISFLQCFKYLKQQKLQILEYMCTCVLHSLVHDIHFSLQEKNLHKRSGAQFDTSLYTHSSESYPQDPIMIQFTTVQYSEKQYDIDRYNAHISWWP